MSYGAFESIDIVLTNEEEFRKKVCGTCEHEEICNAWEFRTMRTLYANKNDKTQEPLKADNGTKGVYRCVNYNLQE